MSVSEWGRRNGESGRQHTLDGLWGEKVVRDLVDTPGERGSLVREDGGEVLEVQPGRGLGMFLIEALDILASTTSYIYEEGQLRIVVEEPVAGVDRCPPGLDRRRRLLHDVEDLSLVGVLLEILEKPAPVVEGGVKDGRTALSGVLVACFGEIFRHVGAHGDEVLAAAQPQRRLPHRITVQEGDLLELGRYAKVRLGELHAELGRLVFSIGGHLN